MHIKGAVQALLRVEVTQHKMAYRAQSTFSVILRDSLNISCYKYENLAGSSDNH